MSDVRTGSEVPARAPAAPPRPEPEPRAARPGARELGRRFLTLREGSIVVVTVLAALYFAVKNDRFFTQDNFETLLPSPPFLRLGRSLPAGRYTVSVRAIDDRGNRSTVRRARVNEAPTAIS